MNSQTRNLLIRRVMDSLEILGPGSAFERFAVLLVEFLCDIRLVHRGLSVNSSPVGGVLDAVTSDGRVVVEASINKSYFAGRMTKPHGDLAHVLSLAPHAEDIYLLCSQRAPTGAIEKFMTAVGPQNTAAGRQVHLMDSRAIAEAIVDQLMLQDQAIDVLSEILPVLGDIRDDHPASLRAPALTSLYMARSAVDAELDRRLDAQVCVEICGIGGIGKSQVAAACLERNRDRFEHSFWVNAQAIQGAEELSAVPLRRGGASRNVSGLLRKNRTLIVLDDARDGLDVDELAALCGPGSKILITRRRGPSSAYELPMMGKRISRELLGTKLPAQPPERVFQAIWKTVGGHPLSLRLINSAVREGISWEDIEEDCTRITDIVDGEETLADRILGRLRPFLRTELSVFRWAEQPYCDLQFLKYLVGMLGIQKLERYGLTAPESHASVRIHDVVFASLGAGDWLTSARALEIDDKLEQFILRHVRDDGHGLQTIANQLHGKIARDVESGDRRPAYLYALAAIWTGSSVRADLLPDPLEAATALVGKNADEEEMAILVVLEAIEALGRRRRQVDSWEEANDWAMSMLPAFEKLETMTNLSARQSAEIRHHWAKHLRILGRDDAAQDMFEAVIAAYPLHDAKLQLVRLFGRRPQDHHRARRLAEEIIGARKRHEEVSDSLMMALGDTLNGARSTWAGDLVEEHEDIFLEVALYSAAAGVSQGYYSIASFVRALVWHRPERVDDLLQRLPEPTSLMLDDDQSRGGYAEIMFHASARGGDRSRLTRALEAYETLKMPDNFQKRKWGETLHKLGRDPEAETLLESFTDVGGRIWLAHSLSQVKLALGKIEPALALVNEAVEGAVDHNIIYRSSFLLQRAKVKIWLGQSAVDDIAEGLEHTRNQGLIGEFEKLRVRAADIADHAGAPGSSNSD